jgi:pimeloyl-ACP methyl ester carboxylesterase
VRQVHSINLETAQGTIAGLHWPAEGRPKVLCLHGWLDNAASFIPLAQHCGELDMVAIDFPGHGLSAHRHPTVRYHYSDYLWDVDAALQALGWQQCHLAGHSMGASLASLYTSGRPDLTLSLTMIDALGPWTGNIADAGKRLRKSLGQMRNKERALKAYASIEDMIKARQGHAELSDNAARALCERAAHRVGDHFEWRTDSRLNWVSPLVITEDQATSCLGGIETPTLSILADSNSFFLNDSGRLESRRDAIGDCQIEIIEGHHHVHMEQPESIAIHMTPFILGNQP